MAAHAPYAGDPAIKCGEIRAVPATSEGMPGDGRRVIIAGLDRHPGYRPLVLRGVTQAAQKFFKSPKLRTRLR